MLRRDPDSLKLKDYLSLFLGGYVCVTSASLVIVILSTCFMYLKFRTYHWETDTQQVTKVKFVLDFVEQAG